MDLKYLTAVVRFPIQMVYYILKACVYLLLPCKRKDLSGSVVLITGGGRGIGRHLAREFAKQGAKKVKYPYPALLVYATRFHSSERSSSFCLRATPSEFACRFMIR